jgi:hypothetical protein
MHRDGDERGLLGCGAGEVGEMTRWGEIKCPRCEELEAKLAKVAAAYRIEAMRRDNYSHEAFDQHLAELKRDTP